MDQWLTDSRFHRRPGAMAMAASPSRVLKGKKLPGQTGSEQVTIQNLEIVAEILKITLS